MHRYVSFISDPRDARSSAEIERVESAFSALSGWVLAYRHRGALVVHKPAQVRDTPIHALANSQGVVLGALFHRNGDPSGSDDVADFGDAATRCIVTSGGLHLVRHYWGSYFAIMRNSGTGRFCVLRDPTASLACFHAKWQNIHVFFSEIEDLKRYVPIPLSVDWQHLAVRLIRGHTLSRECALKEVEDVPGGECVAIDMEGESRSILWNPANFCVDSPIEGEQRAAHEMRTAVLNSVHTLASQHSAVLVQLSGGLDSSIVTACLAQKADRPPVTCLNFYVSSDSREVQSSPLPPGLSRENRSKLRRTTASGDERAFARSVARRCGFSLIEREKRVRGLDLERIWQAPLAPRPSAYILAMDDDDAECECATESQATACFTGHAGDTVFYATLRAIGALDYAYMHPFGPEMLRHIKLTANVSGESITRVIGKAVRYGLLRKPLPMPLEPMKQPHLLADEFAAAVRDRPLRHPWVDSATRLCPGKANHILGVAYSVPFYYNVYHRERIAPSVHPLASQPVVETCLRIPTYTLLSAGVSRGLARQAFGDLLPPEIRGRTVKGTSAAFLQRYVRHNMTVLRDCLLDGYLVRRGLLDRVKLDQYLIKDQPFLTVSPARIMDYLACESWLRQWAPA